MRRPKQKFEQIAPSIEKLLRRCGLYQRVSDYQVFSRWPGIVGEHLARQCRPYRIQGSTLWVSVEDPTLRHHMSFLTPHLLRRIQQEVPEARIQSIRFTIEAPCRQV